MSEMHLGGVEWAVRTCDDGDCDRPQDEEVQCRKDGACDGKLISSAVRQAERAQLTLPYAPEQPDGELLGCQAEVEDVVDVAAGKEVESSPEAVPLVESAPKVRAARGCGIGIGAFDDGELCIGLGGARCQPDRRHQRKERDEPKDMGTQRFLRAACRRAPSLTR